MGGLGLEDSIAYVIAENVELSPVSVDGSVEDVEAPPCIWPTGRAVQGFDEMPSQMTFRAKRLDFVQFFGRVSPASRALISAMTHLPSCAGSVWPEPIP